jgi:hypothetical protein
MPEINILLNFKFNIMKKSFALIICTLFSYAAFSQEPEPQVVVVQPTQEVEVHEHHSHHGLFLLGLRYMPTFTNFDLKSEDGKPLETSFTLGHGFGALVGYNFNEHFGLQAEVIYTQMAQKYRDASMDQEVKLNYINVPVLFVLRTHYSRPVSFNVVIGPQFSANTGSSFSSTDTPEGDSVHAVLAVKPADIGFAYGAGFDFGSERVKFSVGYRGVIGLVDISDNSTNITTDQYYILDRSHVNTYAGYVGLTFGF